MITYPVHFHANGKASSGLANTWSNKAGPFETQCSIPAEFNGPGNALSPEDFFNQALMNCFIGTFKVIAENSKLSFQSLDCASELIVDKDESQKPVMKELTLHVQLKGVTDVEKAKRIAQRAFDTGFILNSVKTACRLSLEVGSVA